MLFADVVGFTPLSERFDPETVREIMDGCFELLTREVERYEGMGAGVRPESGATEVAP